MGDRFRAGIPSQYISSQLGQLSLASLRGRLDETVNCYPYTLLYFTLLIVFTLFALEYKNFFFSEELSQFGITQNATLLILAVLNATKCLSYRVT